MSAVAGRTPIHLGGLPDDDLVRLARAGHEAAFEAIVHRYRAPLQAYCRRWLDAHRAEEVVQHTLMKAFVCVRDDTRPLVLRPWLYRVAHNAALNAVEKKGSDWEQLDENYDGVPQPPQIAERRARFLHIVGEIGALPSRQREALVLNEFEGRCYADIAAELGTSESGVRGLLRRARRQLRETAAAVLLPIPVLRELVRADGGRGAGDLIGTAGAAGGVGAAGGFAKVAAGVLAAGTIASGGTAIQKTDEPQRVRDAKPEVSVTRPAAVHEMTPSLLVSSPQGVEPYAVSTFAMDASRVDTGGGLTAYGNYVRGGVEGIEPDEATSEEPQPEPEPLVPVAAPLPLEGESQEEPAAEEPADGDGDTTESTDDGSEQSPSEETPPPDDQS